jgi:hypothetical protein
MLNAAQFGNEILAQKKRVKYEGTSVIYEGMPVCYNFDTTDNILGYSDSTGGRPECQTTPGTTAEGYQNEGKYLRVEDPAADNLLWFAGVVAGGSWAGKTGDGKTWLEIYVPNGAIVPVRTDLSCTVGRTVLALESASQDLTDPLSATQGRSVAIAEETVDRSSTSGLVLAKLDPNMFIYQDNTGDSLLVGKAAAVTGDMVVNRINVTGYGTGRTTALEIYTTLATAAADNTGYGCALYCETDIAVAVGAQTPSSGFWTNITGGTQTEPIFGLQVGIYESGATVSSSNIISILTLTSQFAQNPQSMSHCWLHLENNGTYAPDCLIRAGAIGDLGAAALSGDVTFSTSGIKIPVYISGSSTTYYIPAQPGI